MEKPLPRVARSGVTALPGDTAGLWAGPGGRAQIAVCLLCFLNGSFKAWLCPSLDVQRMGMGMAPAFQCPAEGRVWIFHPRTGGGRARPFPVAVPGVGVPLLIPWGAQGTLQAVDFPPPAASSPSQGWPQPLWTWQSSRIPCWSPLARDEPTQSCLIPGPRCPWIVPGLSLPSRTLQPPPGPDPLPSHHVDLGVNPFSPPTTWVWQPLTPPILGNLGMFWCFPSVFPRSGWQLPSPCLPWLPPWQPPPQN